MTAKVDTSLRIEGPLLGVGAKCEPILQALPDWFGIDSAVQAYARTIEKLPTFIAQLSEPGSVNPVNALSEPGSVNPVNSGTEQDIAGFLTVKQHHPQSAELYVLGVRCEFHRRGIGRALLAAAERWMGSTGIEYAYVKTIGPSRGCEPWERTRQFYLATGYCPLEEFKFFWAHDPCQIMVKKLSAISCQLSAGEEGLSTRPDRRP
jgi:GNAT superfamily N-acetyltransferase